MAYYRVITPAGHLARGTVVSDDEAAGAPCALFTILPKTAHAMVQSGALEPIPDPVPPVHEEPGWSKDGTKDKEAQQSVARPAREQRRRRD